MSSEELPKTYEPQEIETKWIDFWEKGNFFKADPNSKKKPFTIVMPPPNVTGVLHMGHALVSTLQDTMIRFKRMQGFEALWVPGTDHAGIATQTVVERHLVATTGKRRADFSREEFLEHVWSWKKKSEKTILMQLKKIGCSCDWSRLRFTMDAGCNLGVRTAFKKLFDQGLIYQGNYLVNWDPVAQTALSDDELEYEEQQGHLWYFTYHLVDNPGSITIATTRPETMLGDTAVAVSPKDERYRHLIGQRVHLPIVNRTIPIISDHHVDPAFGTGAVKITPAHDPNDYRMGIDHQLEMINIFTPDGYINENGGPLQGLSRQEARDEVVKQMQELGHFDRVEEHVHRVALSYRSKAVIEPYLSKQWFIKMAPFAEKLKALVKNKDVEIIPSSWENTYFHWIDNLRDWCISRQLWWGHRIPVWHHKKEERMICYEGEGLPPEVEKNPESWSQDPDVLDTWFSSGLWPMSTLGWPKTEGDFKCFYPTNVIITGHDILFFWVARMIGMGEHFTKQVPFTQVFLHGLIFGKSYWTKQKDGTIAYVSDEQRRAYDLGKPVPKGVESKWEKLSKSKGNVIDPLEMSAEYGTDAVRMALCFSANQGAQIDLDRRCFEEFKNFANKIWNGARFVFMHLADLDTKALSSGIKQELLTLEDRWILSRLNRVNAKVVQSLEGYSFDQAAKLSYDFFWKEFCAYYVEIAKPVLFGKTGSAQLRQNKQKILAIVLCNALRLLHPMAPFITEELFGKLKEKFSDLQEGTDCDAYTKELMQALLSGACATSPFPTAVCAEDMNQQIEDDFSLVEQIVYAARNLKGEMKLSTNTAVELYLVGADENVRNNGMIIEALVNTKQLHFVDKAPALSFAASKNVGALLCVIPIPQELIEQEKARLIKEHKKCIELIMQLEKKLGNEQFVMRAKPELVEQQRERLQQAQAELQEIEGKQNNF